MQQGDDVPRAELGPGRLTVEEEIEEFEAYGVSLEVESVLFLGVRLVSVRVCVCLCV